MAEKRIARRSRRSRRLPENPIHLEILHRTPSGEIRRTCCRWDLEVNELALAKWMEEYRKYLYDERGAFVKEALGYYPRPHAAHLRQGALVYSSWGSNLVPMEMACGN